MIWLQRVIMSRSRKIRRVRPMTAAIAVTVVVVLLRKVLFTSARNTGKCRQRTTCLDFMMSWLSSPCRPSTRYYYCCYYYYYPKRRGIS